jgi:hypothetical protein
MLDEHRGWLEREKTDEEPERKEMTSIFIHVYAPEPTRIYAARLEKGANKYLIC